MEDNVLLRQFLENTSEAAFESLVRRHAGLVYSVALRKTGDPHQAEDIAQQVFTILAQKAASVAKHRSLAAWLHRVACYCAGKYIRDQARRRQREKEMAIMDTSNETPGWDRLAPVLDEALDRLPEQDRHALLLRFFEGKANREIGANLGISEEAAKKRVSRGLEKLRGLLVGRGIAIGTSGLALVLEQKATAACPLELPGYISKIAIKTAAMKTGLSLPILTEILIMNTIKYKIAVAAIFIGLLSGVTWFVAKNDKFHATGPREDSSVSSKTAVKSSRSQAARARAEARELTPAELAQRLKALKKAINTYSKNERTRSYPPSEVVEAIWELGGHHKDVFDVLMEAANSRDAEVRHRALSAFGELRDSSMAEDARRFLWTLLRSSNPDDAWAALTPMRILKFQPADIPELANILSTTTNRLLVRYIPEAIATTTAEHPDDSAPFRKTVEDLLSHSSDSVRVAAACALLQPGVTPDSKVISALVTGLGSGGDWQAGTRNLMVLENVQRLGTNGMALSTSVLAYADAAGEEIMRKIAYKTAGILNPELIEQNPKVAQVYKDSQETQALREKIQYSTQSFDDLLTALKRESFDAVQASGRLGEMGAAAKEAIPNMIEALDGKIGDDKDKILANIRKIDPSVKVEQVSTRDLMTAMKDTMVAVANRPESDSNTLFIKTLEDVSRRNGMGQWKTVSEIKVLVQKMEQTDAEAARTFKKTLLEKSPILSAYVKP